MTYEDYVKFTDTTAIYPDANTNNSVEAMYLLIGYHSEYSEYLFSRAVSELGDCFWYLSRLRKIFGKTNMEYYSYVDIDGHIKKYYRDGTINKEIAVWINNQWKILEDDCNYTFHMSVEDVLEMNKAKLSDRKERGVLKGSGDTR